MQQPMDGGQRAEGHSPDGEPVGVLEQSTDRDAVAVDTVGQGAVEVELDPVGEGRRRRFGEPPIEPRATLGPRHRRTVTHQDLHGPVEVAAGHEQVDVGEGPDRRIEGIEVDDRRSLDHEMLDAARRVEPLSDFQQPDLELDAPEQRATLALDEVGLELGRQFDSAFRCRGQQRADEPRLLEPPPELCRIGTPCREAGRRAPPEARPPRSFEASVRSRRSRRSRSSHPGAVGGPFLDEAGAGEHVEGFLHHFVADGTEIGPDAVDLGGYLTHGGGLIEDQPHEDRRAPDAHRVMAGRADEDRIVNDTKHRARSTSVGRR